MPVSNGEGVPGQPIAPITLSGCASLQQMIQSPTKLSYSSGAIRYDLCVSPQYILRLIFTCTDPKGGDAIDAFAMFDNALTPFNSDSWRTAVKSFGGDGGVCGQINKSPGLDRGQFDPKFEAASPTVYCVEPMKANVELLRKCQDRTGINSTSFLVQQFAVGMPEEGQTTIGFPDGRTGAEGKGVVESGGIQVPFTSLDSLFGDLDKVDILSIDTEGNDPDVMFAGKETLEKTRYLEFEVHRDLKRTAWGSTTLQSVIVFLDDLQFDCFWVNASGELFKITQCWNDQYEADSHCWSNVVCAKRGDPWHGILSVKRAMQNKMHHRSGTSVVP